jgi:hypothetical protein
VSLDRYDAWKLAHPASPLRRTPYVHPLRIHIGLVARAEAAELLAVADRVIDRAIANGDLPRWADAEGSSWIAPRDPQVTGAIGLADLLRE